MHSATIRAILDDEVGPVRQLRAVKHPVALLLAYRARLWWFPLRTVRAVLRGMAPLAADVASPMSKLCAAVPCDGQDDRLLAGAIDLPVVLAPTLVARFRWLELGAPRAVVNVVQTFAGQACYGRFPLWAVADVVVAMAAEAADSHVLGFLCARFFLFLSLRDFGR